MISKNALLKVVILGDGAVGKSCLMQSYVNNRFDENLLHTIGAEFLNKEIYLGEKAFILQIWDTAGQERFKSLRTAFYRGSDLCLLVFSLGDKESFKNLLKWKDEFLYYADIKNPCNFPFVVVGNKVDIAIEDREVTTEEVLSWCKDNGDLPYVETSAKNSTNIQEAFMTAVKIWDSLEDRQEKLYDSQTVTLNANQDTKTLYCCPLS